MAKQARSWTENVFPDRYARNARLYPSLLVIAPTVVVIVAIAKIELSGLKTLWVGLGAVGFTYWLSQLARDPGKNLEKKLWDSWGGPPSTTILTAIHVSMQLLKHATTADLSSWWQIQQLPRPMLKRTILR